LQVINFKQKAVEVRISRYKTRQEALVGIKVSNWLNQQRQNLINDAGKKTNILVLHTS
jgi:hypothetical protein